MSFSFRNRFRLNDGDRLDADVPLIELASSADEGLITLGPVERTTGIRERDAYVSEAGELVITGSGFADAETAAVAGRSWRRYLSVALAHEGKGVEFGPEDQVIPRIDILYEHEPPALFQQIGIKTGDRVIMDDYRLLVFPTHPAPRFVNILTGTPRISVSYWLERFHHRIAAAREQNPDGWGRQKTLAYGITHLALRDLNIETCHIQLVTAVETLLHDQDRPQPILDALDELIGIVNS